MPGCDSLRISSLASMSKPRVICLLLWSDFALIKSRSFDSDRRLGPLAQTLRLMSQRDIDEILLIDVGAARARRRIDVSICTEAADLCTVPLTVGGGISDVETARACLREGADRVMVTSLLARSPDTVREIASTLGSSNLVVGVDYRTTERGAECYVDAGRKSVGRSVEKLVEEAERIGAGEILLQSIDRDGQMSGLDIDLGTRVATLASCPIVLAGGVGTPRDVGDALASRRVAAIATGSMYHFTHFTPDVVRQELASRGIPTRATLGGGE